MTTLAETHLNNIATEDSKLIESLNFLRHIPEVEAIVLNWEKETERLAKAFSRSRELAVASIKAKHSPLHKFEETQIRLYERLISGEIT